MNLLFEIEEPPTPQIEGLSYMPNFITPNEEQSLLTQMDKQPWLTDLKRRVQHYGYKYDYKARNVKPNSYLGPLPNWLDNIATKLPFKPDQAIVNEYMPGQGISAHIDCIPCFDDTIVSVSLSSATIMQFSNAKTSQKEELYLEPRSLVTLSGTARYGWSHAIPARKSDIVGGFKTQRSRRVSITFRKIIRN